MVGPYKARLTTYVPASTPKIKSTDLNLWQDTLVRFEAMLSGDVYRFEEDFDAVAVDTNRFSISNTTVVPDFAAGGFGAADIHHPTGAGADVVGQTQLKLPLANRKFRVSVRARVVTKTGAWGFHLGLNDHLSTSNDFVGFITSGTDWIVTVSSPVPPVISTGSPVPVDTNYHTFEIIADPDVDETLNFYIDGVLLASYEWTGSGMEGGDDKFVHIDAGTGGGGGDEARIYADLIRLTAERAP